jgi:threonine dehydrogenase-like Zn-dependent dehydrogenase
MTPRRMNALVAQNHLLRLVTTKILSMLSPHFFVGPTAPIQLREVDEPRLPAGDWTVARTRLCGICGSDYKQVFMNGRADNPMTAMISWPQILGHEVVGVIDEIGPDARQHSLGDRVVLNPWLSCATRGLPLCNWCGRGDLAQCTNFTGGVVEPGIHSGNSATATGGFARRVPAHESQWIPIPDSISDEAAVLADPFAVSLHAVLRNPPSGTALVYGCGTLGLMAIAILRSLHPQVRVIAVARFDHQAKLAEHFGAAEVLHHRPTLSIIENVGRLVGAAQDVPWRGLPMLRGGVDVIYDTVTSPETLEVGVRIADSRARIVALGVEPPKRWEWTPLYFKEISIVGSNGFGIEEFDGRRQHAMAWYFEFLRTREIDVTPLITHRFALSEYRDALMKCYAQGESEAIKVVFDRFD